MIDDITRSQSKAIFKVDVSPSIFQLERRLKLKISEIPMAILLVYSTYGITSSKMVCRDLKMVTIWNIKHSFNLTSDMKMPS